MESNMSVLEQVLREEYLRLNKKINYYKEQLRLLPKGTIFIRKIGNSSYAYRKYKENGKVVSVYLGNVLKESVQNEIALSKDYHQCKESLYNLLFEYKSLKKTIDAFDRKPHCHKINYK